MKKLLLYSSLLVLRSSLCQAQDTLVLRNGQRLPVKVVAVGDVIVYTMPPDDKQKYFRLSKVRYIKYKDGSNYTVSTNSSRPRDTIPVKLKPYILVSGGANNPSGFSGYGGNIYESYANAEARYYSGYAKNGSVISFTAGMDIHNGLEVTAMFSNIRNEFDASGVMTETAVEERQNVTPGSSSYIQSVNAIGSYYYSNFSCLLGFSDSWKKKHAGFGFSLMVGDFIAYTPALHGLATGAIYNATNTIYTNYYLNFNSETQNYFVFELGLHGDVNISHHIFLRGLLELQFAQFNQTYYNGGYQFVDIATGNTLHSGSYGGGGYFIGLFNATAGLGYKF